MRSAGRRVNVLVAHHLCLDPLQVDLSLPDSRPKSHILAALTRVCSRKCTQSIQIFPFPSSAFKDQVNALCTPHHKRLTGFPQILLRISPRPGSDFAQIALKTGAATHSKLMVHAGLTHQPRVFKSRIPQLVITPRGASVTRRVHLHFEQ